MLQLTNKMQFQNFENLIQNIEILQLRAKFETAMVWVR